MRVGYLRIVYVRTLKCALREMSCFVIVKSLCKCLFFKKEQSQFYLVFVCFSIVCWPNSLPFAPFTCHFAWHEEF